MVYGMEFMVYETYLKEQFFRRWWIVAFLKCSLKFASEIMF